MLGAYLDRHRFRLVASGENARPVAQHHQPVRMVHNRARVKRTRRIDFPDFKRPDRYTVTPVRNDRSPALPNPPCGLGDRMVTYLTRGLEP